MIELDKHLIDLLFRIFDSDDDSALSYGEFIAVMNDRRSRGFRVGDIRAASRATGDARAHSLAESNSKSARHRLGCVQKLRSKGGRRLTLTNSRQLARLASMLSNRVCAVCSICNACVQVWRRRHCDAHLRLLRIELGKIENGK